MSTLADDALGWANCVAVVTMSWTFLCVFRFITQPSSYPARPHWRSNMWSAIDVLPWAAMRGYLRVVGKAPPIWIPWALAYSVFMLSLRGCELVVGIASGMPH
jgi:hypothetical protein